MIGNLKPIKLIQYNQSFDVYGDALEAVQTTYKMWAEIEDSGGSKNQELGRTDMTDSKTFKINFRGYLVTGDYKIQYFGQTYAVTNVQRIQEKRFNYLITAFNIFETSVGTTGGTTQNFETVTYNQVTGVFTFTDGNLNGNLLRYSVLNLNGTNYINRFNEQISLGPGPGNERYYPYLTPPDEVIVSWYLIAPDSPTPITGTNTANVTCERLCVRTFRIYEYNIQNSVLSYTIVDNGCYPYNVNGDKLDLAVGIGQFVEIMNADPINAQYFQITSYRLQQTSPFGPNYLIDVSPVDPYFQWNPADTILYIQAEPA